MSTQAQHRRQNERDSTGQYTSYTPDESGVSLLASADTEDIGEDGSLGSIEGPAGGWGRVSLSEGSSSPWGPIQHVTHHGEGIAQVDTDGHGGVKLSAARNRAIPAAMRSRSGWYEEDCEAAVPMWHYPDEFADERRNAERIRQFAESSLRDWHPDDYEALTGREATEENSRTRAHRARERSVQQHRKAHSDEFVTLGAGSDNRHHSWAPDGYAVCEARMDDTGETGHYLMDKSDVITDGMYGQHVVVDPNRHVDVSEVVDSGPDWPDPWNDTPTERIYGDDLGISTDHLSPAAGQRARRELDTTYRFRGEGEDGSDVVETLEQNLTRAGIVGKERMSSDRGGTDYRLSLGDSRLRPVSKATFDAVTGVEDHTSARIDTQIRLDKAERRVDKARKQSFGPGDGREKLRRAQSDRDEVYEDYRQASEEADRAIWSWREERDEIQQAAWENLVQRKGLSFD